MLCAYPVLAALLKFLFCLCFYTHFRSLSKVNFPLNTDCSDMVLCVQQHNAEPNAEIITLNQVNTPATSRSLQGANAPTKSRTYVNTVVLPTGEVALIGGASLSKEFSDEFAHKDIGAYVLRIMRPFPRHFWRVRTSSVALN